jgi:hypothetical protein
MRTASFPNRVHLEHLGSKAGLTKRLDFISDSMGTKRPKTTPLKRGGPIPTGVVLKRTQSDCQSHVFLPKSNRPVRWEDLKEGPPGSVWLAQDFVPELRSLGEWRSVIVGGDLVYVVHTNYDDREKGWKFVKADTFYSLEEIG